MNPKEDIFYKILLKLLTLYKVGGVLLVLVAFVVLMLNMSPGILYSLDGGAVAAETDLLISTVEASDLKLTPYESNSNQYNTANKLPEKNPNLTTTPTLYINKIAVNGIVHEGSDPMTELEKGIWRDPELGNPLNGLPTVIASHRFGYASWSNDFRTKNSFYNLPQLQPGDEIVFVWDQREFKYTVKKTFEDTHLSNIDADLVLYTCRFFRNDTRFIVYADLTI